MCWVLKVARSGRYAWQARRSSLSPRVIFRGQCDAVVSGAFHQAKQCYGSPRLTDALREQGFTYNVKTVAASLKRQGLRAITARRFSPVSYSKHSLPVFDNLLAQDFSANAPDEKWVQGITYLRIDEGWLYLAVVIDLWSRAVIGWSMSSRMTAQLVCDALQIAVMTMRVRKASLHSLKVECIHGERFISREEMRTTVFNYIECDYNRWRRHCACGGLSPEQFENQNLV